MTEFEFNNAAGKLGDFHIMKAAKIAKHIGIGYCISDSAPDTFEKLCMQFAHCLKNRQAFPVYSGGNENTIYGDNFEANYAFRFIHDWLHYDRKADFTPIGELQALETHIKWVSEKFGDNSLELRIFKADTIGQVCYNQVHNGAFPENQKAFVMAQFQEY